MSSEKQPWEVKQTTPNSYTLGPISEMDQLKKRLVDNALELGYDKAMGMAWFLGVSGLPDVCKEIVDRKPKPLKALDDIIRFYMGYPVYPVITQGPLWSTHGLFLTPTSGTKALLHTSSVPTVRL